MLAGQTHSNDQSGPEWIRDVLYQQDGVTLLEIGVGVFMLEYEDQEFPRAPIFYSWPEASANYARRVKEAIERNRK